MSKPLNILALGAHYDDIELGCAGTLINHVNRKHNVTMVVVSDSGYSDPSGKVIRQTQTARKEGQAGAQIIGANLIELDYKTFYIPFDESLTSTLTGIIQDRKIDTIFCHWTKDIHRDHQRCAKSVIMAARHVPRILMYQSNWYDGDQRFNPLIYSDISDVFAQKLDAVRAHASELGRTDQAWIDYLKARHRADGLKMGVQYAEAFEPVRYLMPEDTCRP